MIQKSPAQLKADLEINASVLSHAGAIMRDMLTQHKHRAFCPETIKFWQEQIDFVRAQEIRLKKEAHALTDLSEGAAGPEQTNVFLLKGNV